MCNSSHDLLFLSTNFICFSGFGGAVSTSFSYACAFAAVKTYVDIRARVGLYGAFWIYSAISIAGLFFVCCLVPETKGVELEEMEHHTNINLPISTTTTVNLNPPSNNPMPSNMPVYTQSTTTCSSSTNPSSSAPSNLAVMSHLNFTKVENYPPPLRTPPGSQLTHQIARKYPSHLPLNFDKPLQTSSMITEQEIGMPKMHSHVQRFEPSPQDRRIYYKTQHPISFQATSTASSTLSYQRQFSDYNFPYSPECPPNPGADYSFHFPDRNFLQHTQYHPLSQNFVDTDNEYDDELPRQRSSYQYVAHRGSELVPEGVIFRPNKGSIV